MLSVKMRKLLWLRYKQNIKVYLIRGKDAFLEAAQELRKMNPLSPLQFKNEICIPLPQDISQFQDSNFLREKIKKMLGKNIIINTFFKDLVNIPEVSVLLMIVDDNGNSSGKKRKAILNKNYKYIGISHKYIGNKFIAYFSFSK